MKSRVIKNRMHEGELESDLIGVRDRLTAALEEKVGREKIENKVYFDTLSLLLCHSSLFS